VYSLGVCLLEIGLWDVLVRPEEDQFSNLLKNVVDVKREDQVPNEIKWLYPKEQEPENQDSDEEEADSGPRGPEVVKASLIRIARKELPPKMGTPFADLVVACLTCLDDNAGSIWRVRMNDERGMTPDIQQALVDVVVSKLRLTRLS
jgi:hypothetical protein